MAKLDGKIALISGGTTGIGAETAKLFQSEGATVIVTGSSERSVAAAKAALPGIEVLVSDAGNVAATKALVDQVKAKHGRIDVLFVNAGIAKFAPIAQVDEAFYDSQFNINVKGAFFLIKHAIPVIPDGGAIILTASVAGANGGLGGGSVYGSTKAALRSFGRTIAKELTPRGIRVNTISPGPIVTPILDKGGLTPAQKDTFIEGAKTRIPLGRTGTASRSRRRGPLPCRRCHLHHRRRAVRRRRLDRPLGPQGRAEVFGRLTIGYAVHFEVSVTAVLDQLRNEARARVQFGNIDMLVRLMGLRDRARTDHYRRNPGHRCEQSCLRSERYLVMLVATRKRLGERDQWHVRRGFQTHVG